MSKSRPRTCSSHSSYRWVREDRTVSMESENSVSAADSH